MEHPRRPGMSLWAAWRVAKGVCRLVWVSARGPVTVTFVASLVLGSVGPAIAWLTKVLLDVLSLPADGHAADPLLVVGAIGIATTFAGTLPLVTAYATEESVRRIGRRVQGDFLEHLGCLPGLRHFETPSFHDRLQLAQQGGQNGPPVLVVAITGLGRGIIALGSYLVAVTAISPALAALIALRAIPQLVAEQVFARRRVRLAVRLTRAERRRMFFTVLQTDPRAAKEIRLFEAGGFLRRRTLEELAAIDAQERALALRTGKGRAALAALSAAVAAGAAGIAVLEAIDGHLTVGDVALALAAIAGVQGSALGVMDSIAKGSESALRFTYFLDFMDTGSDLPQPQDPVPLAPLGDGITFHDVWFRYTDDGPWVLRGVDLHIPAGRSLAIVGPNGAGKSTIIKLIARLYDPTAGHISWDGVDIRDVSIADLRCRLAPVVQDFGAYELTVAENIAFADGATDPAIRPRIEAAGRAAGADVFITDLPQGYDTMLSRTFAGTSEAFGVELSGGQWQRIALARMYFRGHAEVLLLDEPTSSLDVEAEARLFDHVEELVGGRTSIVISHRIASTRSADLMVVIEDGVVVETGDPRELLASGGRYATMLDLQARTGARAS